MTKEDKLTFKIVVLRILILISTFIGLGTTYCALLFEFTHGFDKLPYPIEIVAIIVVCLITWVLAFIKQEKLTEELFVNKND
jgi:hypothetical protein